MKKLLSLILFLMVFSSANTQNVRLTEVNVEFIDSIPSSIVVKFYKNNRLDSSSVKLLYVDYILSETYKIMASNTEYDNAAKKEFIYYCESIVTWNRKAIGDYRLAVKSIDSLLKNISKDNNERYEDLMLKYSIIKENNLNFIDALQGNMDWASEKIKKYK